MGIRTTQTGYSGEEKYNIRFVCEAILILYSACSGTITKKIFTFLFCLAKKTKVSSRHFHVFDLKEAACAFPWIN